MFGDLLTRLGKNIGLVGPGGIFGGGGGEMKLDPMGKGPFAPDKGMPMPGPAGGVMPTMAPPMTTGQDDVMAELRSLLGGGQGFTPQPPQPMGGGMGAMGDMATMMPRQPMADPRASLINKFPRPPRQFMRGPY